MKTSAIHGKILELTRCLFLTEPTGITTYREQGMVANGWVLTWWRTDQTRRVEKVLANQAMKSSARLQNGDIETFSREIGEVIKNLLFDPALFRLLPGAPGAVFDQIVATDKVALAARIWNDYITACESKVTDWLTIHPLLGKVALATGVQTFGSLSIIATTDTSAWKALEKKFPGLVEFSPQLGTYLPAGYGFKNVAQVWLVAEHTGTAKGAQTRAAREMAVFLALAFAFAAPAKRGLFLKSGEEPDTRALQFSATHVNFVPFGELCPPLLHKLSFDAALMTEVAAWYGKRALATGLKAARATTAAAFLHHAIIADDLEKFVHTFIVVDALFGERGHVRTKIKEGILKVFSGDATWQQKTDMLFDLRSQIVHGGISDLDDWSEDFDYTTKFNATPFADAVTMATTALRVYLDLP